MFHPKLAHSLIKNLSNVLIIQKLPIQMRFIIQQTYHVPEERKYNLIYNLTSLNEMY